MNELIKPIELEAMKYAIAQHPIDEAEDQNIRKLIGASRIGTSNRKIVELVVLECCQYLRNEAERLYALQTEDGDLLAEKCYDNIAGLKEHFGVEENGQVQKETQAD